MRDVLNYLDERREEFASHLTVARMLEARVDEGTNENDLRVEVRHINTIKSGLLVHLYNIVEAVTTRTLETVGRTVVTKRPALWTEAVLKEWVRAAVWSGEEKIGEGAFKRLAGVSRVLVSGNAPEEFIVKGEPGSWNDEAIKKVANRLGCQLRFSPEISRAAFERKYRDETTAMQFLADRRNAIAHGSTTFEEGARSMTLDNLEELAGRVLPFLKAVTECYKAYLDTEAYLQTEEAAA
ncbi:MAE_28990/MAE_18760 family HEPN-like nuclease [Azospirillum sp. B2RO_4]|uniref:MAE_28990/MAE_18760 family HEPN-like nuclease n=1 Tax=Azospirillum sp. B2RO_4 TaxID=3027796 RepID=UPI003DA810B8